MLSSSFQTLLESHLDSREECGENVCILFGVGCVEVLANCAYASAAEFQSSLIGTEWGVCRGFQTAVDMERGVFR